MILLLSFLLIAAVLLGGRGYLHISHWRWWRWMLTPGYGDSRVGIFRNLPSVKPGRWGVFIFGLEIGSRSPDDRVGVWLKNHGLWPW